MTKYPIIIMVIARQYIRKYCRQLKLSGTSGLLQRSVATAAGRENISFNKSLSQTINIPQLRGKAERPNLMFDDYVYRAPVWVEIFHVFAGGSGPGYPHWNHSPRDRVKAKG
jgi:hypothetical protein